MDQIGLDESLTNYNDVGKISLEETGMIPFLLLRSAQVFTPIEFNPAVFNRYVSFVSMLQDNYSGTKKETI